MAAKLNIKDVAVANEKLVRDTALETREKPEAVEDIVKHIGQFVAGTMARGMMEAVMIPGFGKFQPKKEELKARHKVLGNQRSGMDLLYRAVTGKKLIDKRNKDETI